MIDDLNLPTDTNPTSEIQQNDAEVQQEQQEQQQVVAQQQPSKELNEERNFRALREKADRIQRERDEALVRLKHYEAAQNVESEALNLGPDDLAEGKHLNKVENKIKALEHQLMESKLRSQYPDIDSVVNDDTIAILKAKHPELAQTIGANKNLYSQAVTAYTMIKQLGISQDTTYDADKNLAQRNASKPKPLASVAPQQGDTPLSRANAFANGLTDELKKQLHREMIEAMRNK
jgi:hypothetical protein